MFKKAIIRHKLFVETFIFAGFLILASTDVAAQNHTMKGTQQAGTESSADSKFADEAACGGISEVKLGELAKERGSSQSVQAFGERMVADHSKANDELKQVAQGKNIQLPQQPKRTDQNTYDRLSKLSGSEFDRAYAEEMVKDHEKDIAAFEKEASSGQDPEFKEFASRTLPTLKDHLKLAREMERAVEPSASSRL